MAKSQLIKDLATNKISLEEALQRLLVITSELNNEELNKWILGELNGYSIETELPSYRKNIASHLVYSGINGPYKVTNVALPLNFLSEDIREIVKQTPLRTSIRGIEKMLELDGKLGMDLMDLAGDIYKNTGIGCYKIFKEYSRISIEEVVSNVKNKLLLFLIDLEKEFGNLDNMDIDLGIITDEQSQKIKKTVNRIYYDNTDEII